MLRRRGLTAWDASLASGPDGSGAGEHPCGAGPAADAAAELGAVLAIVQRTSDPAESEPGLEAVGFHNPSEFYEGATRPQDREHLSELGDRWRQLTIVT